MGDDHRGPPLDHLHRTGTAPSQILKLFFCGTLLVPLLDGITAESNQDLFHKLFSESSKMRNGASANLLNWFEDCLL